VRAIGVLIRDIVFDEAAQVSLVEDESMIQKVSATASNPAFGDSILPGRLETDPVGFDASGHQQIHHIHVELRLSIQNRRAVGTRFRESFAQLLNYPRTRRILRRPCSMMKEQDKTGEVRAGRVKTTYKKSMAAMTSR